MKDGTPTLIAITSLVLSPLESVLDSELCVADGVVPDGVVHDGDGDELEDELGDGKTPNRNVAFSLLLSAAFKTIVLSAAMPDITVQWRVKSTSLDIISPSESNFANQPYFEGPAITRLLPSARVSEGTA